MNPDVKHLKWNLINKEGLTPERADARIKEMQDFQEKVKKKKKADKRKTKRETKKK